MTVRIGRVGAFQSTIAFAKKIAQAKALPNGDELPDPLIQKDPDLCAHPLKAVHIQRHSRQVPLPPLCSYGDACARITPNLHANGSGSEQ